MSVSLIQLSLQCLAVSGRTVTTDLSDQPSLSSAHSLSDSLACWWLYLACPLYLLSSEWNLSSPQPSRSSLPL